MFLTRFRYLWTKRSTQCVESSSQLYYQTITNVYKARTAISSASSEQLNPYLLKELLTGSQANLQVPNSDRPRNSPGLAWEQQSHTGSLPLHLPFSAERKSLRCPSSCTHLSGYLVHVLHVRLEIQITVSIHNSVSIHNTASHSIQLYVWRSKLRTNILYPLATNTTCELFYVQVALFSNRKFPRQQVAYFSNELWNTIPEGRFK